jgi:hypothetical protein
MPHADRYERFARFGCVDCPGVPFPKSKSSIGILLQSQSFDHVKLINDETSPERGTCNLPGERHLLDELQCHILRGLSD